MTEQSSRDIIDHINPEEGDDVFEERKLCRSEASGMPLLLFPCGWEMIRTDICHFQNF